MHAALGLHRNWAFFLKAKGGCTGLAEACEVGSGVYYVSTECEKGAMGFFECHITH